MKAIILAAGKGSRLKKITKNFPKPMIKIDGKPILEHNIEMCRIAGIDEIFINLNHYPELIKDYFGDGSNFGVKITYNYESYLLGTAGALIPFKEKITPTPFFVIYGDNYINFDLLKLSNFNNKSNGDISILFHWRRDVNNSGVANFDKNGKIIKFIEKPVGKYKNGGWVNAGIYFIQFEKIFFRIKEKDDFGINIFPKLLKENVKLFGLKTNSKLSAFDTPELYAENI